MGNVVNLEDIRKMQEALNDAAIPADDHNMPRMIAYCDIHGMPQLIVEGNYITQQQLNNMPGNIRELIRTEDD